MKNKPLIVMLIILVIGIIGGTYAIFTNTKSLQNIFGTRNYHTEVTEEFVSPDDWQPGMTTGKKVYVKNTGQVNMAIRVSYTEEWVSGNGNSLPLKQGDNVAAIINFVNQEDWTKNGDYYYYNKSLLPGETTTSFIDSVTFNKAIQTDATCTTVQNKQSCISSGNGYDGGTYTLKIKVETIQESAKEELWGV